MPWKPWQSFPRCARWISTSQPQIFLCLLKNITLLLTCSIYSSFRRIAISNFSSSFSLPLSSKNKVLKGLLIFPELASLCLGDVCSCWVLQRCLSHWNIIYRDLCAHQGRWVVWSPGWGESDKLLYQHFWDSQTILPWKNRVWSTSPPMSSSWTSPTSQLIEISGAYWSH